MIKIFKNIRKKLAAEQKAMAYLRYAIGEILLVVIGILIALQINNWNENRKTHIKEIALLNQLKSEFQSNLDQLDEKISIRNEMIAASFKLLGYVDNPAQQNKDSIIKYIVPTLLVPTFDPVINDIMSSGRIQLLQNSKLKGLLSRWTSEIVQVTEEEVSWRVYKEKNQSLIASLIPLRNVFNKYWQNNTMELFYLDKGTSVKFNLKNSAHNFSTTKLLENSDFENYIVTCATSSKIANIQSVSLRKRIVEILDLIEKELKESK
jgi:hypothetical protein